MKLRIIIAAVLALLLTIPLSASAQWYKKETLVDVAVKVNQEVVPGAFDTLLALVTANPRVFRRLDNPWIHTTVFAPTDEAFENLFALVEAELCLTPDQVPDWYVNDVLTYHLSRGTKLSGDVFGSHRVRMLFGGYLFPNADDLSLADNTTNSGVLPNAGIVAPYFDVEADNGVIHVVDRVLLPYLPPSNCD